MSEPDEEQPGWTVGAGEKVYSLRMRRETWRELRRVAADTDSTVKTVILTAVRFWLSLPKEKRAELATTLPAE